MNSLSRVRARSSLAGAQRLYFPCQVKGGQLAVLRLRAGAKQVGFLIPEHAHPAQHHYGEDFPQSVHPQSAGQFAGVAVGAHAAAEQGSVAVGALFGQPVLGLAGQPVALDLVPPVGAQQLGFNQVFQHMVAVALAGNQAAGGLRGQLPAQRGSGQHQIFDAGCVQHGLVHSSYTSLLPNGCYTWADLAWGKGSQTRQPGGKPGGKFGQGG